MAPGDREYQRFVFNGVTRNVVGNEVQRRCELCPREVKHIRLTPAILGAAVLARRRRRRSRSRAAVEGAVDPG